MNKRIKYVGTNGKKNNVGAFSCGRINGPGYY